MAYVVIVNAPGYLPDAEPCVYPTFADAFFALIAEMVATREALYSEDDDSNGANTRLEEAIDAATHEIVERPETPFGIQLFGINHEIAKAQ